jgi:hypothetical protein
MKIPDRGLYTSGAGFPYLSDTGGQLKNRATVLSVYQEIIAQQVNSMTAIPSEITPLGMKGLVTITKTTLLRFSLQSPKFHLRVEAFAKVERNG